MRPPSSSTTQTWISQAHPDQLPCTLKMPVGRAASPDDAQRRVMAGMARRARLARPDAPQLDAIVDEAALRHPVGGAGVTPSNCADCSAPGPT